MVAAHPHDLPHPSNPSRRVLQFTLYSLREDELSSPAASWLRHSTSLPPLLCNRPPVTGGDECRQHATHGKFNTTSVLSAVKLVAATPLHFDLEP